MTREEQIREGATQIANKIAHQWSHNGLDYDDLMHAATKAIEWADEHPKPLWKDAQGDDLPEIDREVIVIDKIGKICFGHRPNPKGYHILGDEMVGVQTYGKGGWNIPDVKWWLDAPMPNMED